MPPETRPEDEDTREHVLPDFAPPASPPGHAADRPTPSPAVPGPSLPGHDGPAARRSEPPGSAGAPPPAWPSAPPQPGWGQPQPQPGWQQPQPGWQQQQQQPGWQAPPPHRADWSAAGYWQHEPPYGSNALVWVAAIFLTVVGVLVTLVGIFGLIAGMFVASVLEDVLTPDMAQVFDLGAFGTILTVAFGVVLVLGLLHLLSAIGIFAHKGWARAIGVVLSVLGTLFGVLAVVAALELARNERGDLIVALVIAVGYGVTLFALIAGGGHFRRRYPG